MLHERGAVTINVFYTWSQSATGSKYDPGFQKEIAWDIPLLNGYPYVFSENVSTEPGSHHNKGIDNPFLIKEVSEWGADAVLVYGWNFKSHLQLMRFFHKKIPVWFRGDSTLLDEKPGVKQLLRRFYLRHIFKVVDKAFYAGTANKAYFLAHGLKENELYFMPHAIDNNRFAASEENKQQATAIRKDLGIPSDALVFLFAGKLEKKKQPVMLLNTFAAIDNENAYLIIAGSGEQKEKLKNLTKGKGHIKLLDFQNQQHMPALYAACNVFVLPSKGPNETWGLAINEAMAAAKAVIASNACGATQDLIENGKNGFAFGPHDTDELKRAMQYFINNIDAVQTFGDTSSKMINNYNFKTDCEAIEHAVAEINPN